MTSPIFHIARNTFREAVRDRVLYNLVGICPPYDGRRNFGRASLDWD